MKKLILLIIFLSGLFAQTQQAPTYAGMARHQVSSKRYFTDEFGNILMNVNFWGHVNSPGRHVVYDGIDLATLLSMVGGPKTGANLKKVRLFRETEDDNGKLVYEINMENFLKTGDRGDFVKVLPNDTYIVPQTVTSYVMSQVGTLNTFLSVANIYLQILYRQDQR